MPLIKKKDSHVEVPESYFEDGTWTIDDDSVPKQVYDLMRYLIGLPEFQLK